MTWKRLSSQILCAGLLVTGALAGPQEDALRQSYEASVQSLKGAIRQVEAAGGDASQIRASLANLKHTHPGAKIAAPIPGNPDMSKAAASMQKWAQSMAEAQAKAQAQRKANPSGIPGNPDMAKAAASMQKWAQSMAEAQAKAQGQAWGATPHANPMSAAQGGVFTQSLQGLRMSLEMLKQYGQKTSDIAAKIKALESQTKVMDSLYAQTMKYAMNMQAPPDSLSQKLEKLTDALQPKMQEISALIQKRSVAMQGEMQQKIMQQIQGLEASTQMNQGGPQNLEALQSQMEAMRKKAMEAMGQLGN